MSEEQAFDMLKFLMYDLGIRQQYKPDMVSLQVRAQVTQHIILMKIKRGFRYVAATYLSKYFIHCLMAVDFFLKIVCVL